jgi:UDP-glucose 4-epimerase
LNDLGHLSDGAGPHAEWYRGRSALAVGGLGYIGSNLVSALIDAGARVTILTPSLDRHEAAGRELVARGARILAGDVRQLADLREAVRGQDVVFNVSGQSGALESVQEPVLDLDVNCVGNLRLLEALRLESAGAKLVFAGSRLVYGAPRELPVIEDHPLAPLCPHGVHKAMVEHYLAIYGRLHGIRATSLRITNPYGPGQPVERRSYGVINYLIHQALADRTVPIYGDGGQRRDYVFVGDVVDAMLLAGRDARSDGRIYNIGSGVGTRMIDAARLIIDTVGGGRIEFQPWPPMSREIDTGDFIADIRRAGAELGWRPATDLADGLRQTVAASALQSTRL